MTSIQPKSPKNRNTFINLAIVSDTSKNKGKQEFLHDYCKKYQTPVSPNAIILKLKNENTSYPSSTSVKINFISSFQ